MCYDECRKTERVMNLKRAMNFGHGKKEVAQVVFLVAGVAMLCFGIWRGEAVTVLSKAIKLCLECVGIG